MVFFYLMSKHLYVWALVSYLGIVFDGIDGIIARSQNKVTAWGAFLDSSLDRVADFFYLSAFAWAGLISWEIISVVICLSLLISYLRSRAELAGKSTFVLNIGIIERSERLIFILIALLVIIFFPNLTWFEISLAEWIFFTLIGLSAFTVLQRFVKAYKLLQTGK